MPHLVNGEQAVPKRLCRCEMLNSIHVNFLLSALALAFMQHSIAVADPQNIERDDFMEHIENACSKEKLSRLHADVIDIAGLRAPEQAWRLINEMLCGTTENSIKYVRSNSYDAVLFEDNRETDDASIDYSYIPSKNLKTVQGQAWDAQVNNIKGDIRAVFTKNRFCAGDFDIHFDNTKWKISKAGVACD